VVKYDGIVAQTAHSREHIADFVELATSREMEYSNNELYLKNVVSEEVNVSLGLGQ